MLYKIAKEDIVKTRLVESSFKSIESCHSLKVVIHWKLSFFESCHSLKAVIHWKLSFIETFIHWKLSFFESCHSLKAVIHWKLSSFETSHSWLDGRMDRGKRYGWTDGRTEGQTANLGEYLGLLITLAYYSSSTINSNIPQLLASSKAQILLKWTSYLCFISDLVSGLVSCQIFKFLLTKMTETQIQNNNK